MGYEQSAWDLNSDMKESCAVPGILKSIWGAMALAPVLIISDAEIGTLEIAIFAFGVYGLGWLFLMIALSRDPEGKALKSFACTVAACVATVAAILALQALGTVVSVGAALLLFLMIGALFWALWAWNVTGKALSTAIGKVLLLVATLCITFAIVEIFFRLPPVVEKTGGNTPGMYRWAQENYDRIWEKNPLGLRSFHTNEPKRSGTLRILTLGDSFTWGYLIARTEDTWPYVLETVLREKGYPVEVINLGRNGYSTLEEKKLLEDIGWLFKPDLIILQFTLNDPIPTSYGTYFRLYPLVPGFNDFLNNHSYFFSFIYSRFRALQMQLLYPERESALFAEDFAGWRVSKKAIWAMADEAKRREASMITAIFPLFGTKGLDQATYPFLQAHEEIQSVCRTAGIPFLDLRQLYAEKNPKSASWWALPSDSHPNVEGHRLAGQAIADMILSHSFLR